MAQSKDEILAEVRADEVGDQTFPDAVHMTDIYRALNDDPLVGIRPRYAERVLREGVRQKFVVGEGLDVYLAADRVDASPPYTMLVLGVDHPDSGPGVTVDFVWRIYSEADVDPATLFADLLTDFGLAVIVGFEKGLFIGDALAPEIDGDTELVVIESEPGQTVDRSSFFLPTESDSYVRWAFAIDRDAYLARVRAASRD